MEKRLSMTTLIVLLALVTTSAFGASTVLELTAPDGRKILLKSDGTWSYVDELKKDDNAKKPQVAKKPEGELLLLLSRKIDRGLNCAYALQLVNKTPYEIQSLVLHFAAYRPNGVLYATETPGSQFSALKPGNSQTRQVEFQGIGCQDIVRVQVTGGDGCTMGDLHRWVDRSEYQGKCLERVKVVESNVVRFEK
jgi:Protein of unknown function (DUF3157)